MEETGTSAHPAGRCREPSGTTSSPPRLGGPTGRSAEPSGTACPPRLGGPTEEAGPPPEVRLDLPGAGWSDWRWLALLLALVAGLRAWQLTHTEVASRDSIGYIRYAWRLENEPWTEVM